MNPDPRAVGRTATWLTDKQLRNFAQKHQPNENGCWIWTGCINAGGYGRFGVHSKKRPAHRVSYEIYVGPIPEGLHIDHLCRNRACVNPAHLEPVTNRENSLRGDKYNHSGLCPKCGKPYNRFDARKSGHPNRRCGPCTDAQAYAAERQRRELGATT